MATTTTTMMMMMPMMTKTMRRIETDKGFLAHACVVPLRR
jgi:hypothetical protein